MTRIGPASSPILDSGTWLRALAAMVVALSLYWGTATLAGKTHTPDYAYFNHLAKAFLHKQLYLDAPPTFLDLTLHQGHWYVPFPPLPALLLIPWVASCGLAATNTVLFSSLFGALNVALIYLFLELLSARRWTRLNTTDNIWLTMLFGIGSVHWYLAPIGSVWFVAQICTVTFAALAACLAASRFPLWLSGVALGLAMWGRPNMVLALPLLLGMAAERLRDPTGQVDWRRWIRWSGSCIIPAALAIVALLAYNQARFGQLLDFGYRSENVAKELAATLHQHGQFSLHYLARNLKTMWLALPKWNPIKREFAPSPLGMSLLLTTPALIYLLRARLRSWLTIGAWVALILLLVPLALYYNTGWWQFGYRFSLDFMVPVMALLAVAAVKRVSWPMRGLILAGILVNAWGVAWWFFWWFR